ncbi:O-antigen ligase family protein [Paucihalobacter ruber]|uniref:O-antigen ligase family protein n=1 Tax=Paucihalobacter ruber TaxID=2567861 RepID=A0A506PL49_9FLAO|nr:O-antigen ligase family protein [Paucihalobacter ruber]TPV33837.1 O-antigen ligase family protein [Paucihalobacter ruber]
MAFNTKDKYLQLVLLHIGLGVLIFAFQPLANGFFLLATFYFLLRIILVPPSAKTREILLACAYFTGAEIFFRMTKGGLAYESSKYLVILFMSMGIFYKGVSGKGYPYFIYLILMVPAILVASNTLSWGANFRTNIAFVLSGPVCLGMAALFCYDRKVSVKTLLDVNLYILLPIITTTTYIYLYNPSIKDVLSGTASNAAASGGFGPNQVATILGLGMFAAAIRIFLQSPTVFLKVLNTIILSAMTYRAIVTFSRGGIFAAVIAIVAFLAIYFFQAKARRQGEIIISMGLFFVAILMTWNISSTQTYGLIDKRYANQDALGREKSDLTTGRVQLFLEEVDGFINHPFLGIGASRVKDIRVERDGDHLPSHNELGRLMSEHGFLGIVIILILIIKPLDYRSRNRNNLLFFAFLAFWFATINHSGMRIAAPAFLYALSLINVTNETPALHRKQR